MQREKAPFLIRLIVWLVLVLLLVGVGGFIYWNNMIKAVDANGQPKAFVIQPGESVDAIANSLEKQGLVKSSLIFKVMLKLSGDSTKIEAGDYKLSGAMSTVEIVQTLNKGAIDRWVTLIEGWRVEQVAKQLNQDLGVKTDEVLQAAKGKEGHLFPDTYLFNKDVTTKDIVSVLENTFNKKYAANLQAKIKANGLTSEQGVVLASIVEREGRTDKVRENIASILLKRFKIEMALQVDATVQYAKDTQSLKEGKLTKFWQPITKADYKEVESPFNTYLHPGLPPTPICNPSLSSLKAVANADSSTEYLYYYVDSQGNIYYAKTLDEHNVNIANHH